MIGFPRATEDARLVPELRAALIDFAAPGGIWEQMEVQMAMMRSVNVQRQTEAPDGSQVFYGPEGFSADELQARLMEAQKAGINHTEWYRRHLPHAQCIWMSSELVDVLEAAIESVPDDVVLSREMLPSPTGIIVFQRPIYGLEALREHYPEGPGVRMDALLWGETKLADFGDTEGTNCISVSVFRMVTPEQDDPFAIGWYKGLPNTVQWAPLGRTDWPIGHPISKDLHGLSERQAESMREDKRLMAAMWALIQQKRIVERTEVEPQRPSRRRMQRAGHSVPNVTIVHLRANEYAPSGAREGHREYKHRWIVRPHFRHQAYGPGRSKRRLILVPPHVKGPADAPLMHPERVWAVDR